MDPEFNILVFIHAFVHSFTKYVFKHGILFMLLPLRDGGTQNSKKEKNPKNQKHVPEGLKFLIMSIAV